MELPDLGKALGVDVSQLAEETRLHAARAAELQARMRGMVGRAESKDGRVRLAFSHQDGLPELVIDPRAMRLGAEELATLIQDLVKEAVGDLDRQRQEARQETYGPDFDPEAAKPDPEGLRNVLQGMTESVESAGQNLTALMDQMRSRFGQ
jgi:DNA-binding protein YbaB